MTIRVKVKIRNFFKYSGITVLFFLAIIIAASSAVSLLKNDKNIISLIVSTRNNPFFKNIIDAAELEISKHPSYQLQVFDSKDNDAEQVKNIDSAIVLDSKAVIINVVNSETALQAGVSKLIQNSIPIIAVDRQINNALVDLTIASDNILGAQNLARSFLDKTLNKPEPNISLKSDSIFQLRGVPGSQASSDRNTGFREVFPNSISESLTANFSREEAFGITNNFLATDNLKNTKVIFAENDEMALGAINAIKSQSGWSVYSGSWTEFLDGKIYVLGFDGTSDALNSIDKDEMYATVIQQPAEMGRIAIDETIKYFITGSFSSTFIGAPTTVVDKSNVADYI